MEFEEILRKRHSVRKFDNRQIREDMLWDIIDDARKSPSWANAQERGVYIASKEKAKLIRKEFIERAEKEMIGISDFSFTHRNEWSARAQKNMEEFENSVERYMGEDFGEYVKVQDTLYDAPVIVFLTLPKGAPTWAILDLGAFEMALMFSATAHGLDSMVAYAFVKYSDVDEENIIIGIGLVWKNIERIISIRIY